MKVLICNAKHIFGAIITNLKDGISLEIVFLKKTVDCLFSLSIHLIAKPIISFSTNARALLS